MKGAFLFNKNKSFRPHGLFQAVKKLLPNVILTGSFIMIRETFQASMLFKLLLQYSGQILWDNGNLCSHWSEKDNSVSLFKRGKKHPSDLSNIVCRSWKQQREIIACLNEVCMCFPSASYYIKNQEPSPSFPTLPYQLSLPVALENWSVLFSCTLSRRKGGHEQLGLTIR